MNSGRQMVLSWEDKAGFLTIIIILYKYIDDIIYIIINIKGKWGHGGIYFLISLLFEYLTFF